MDKHIIIKEIADLAYEGYGDESYIALHNSLVFSHDSCRYDLMGIGIDEENGWVAECIGYHHFSIYYIKLEDLRPVTLNRIKKVLSASITE